MPHYFVRARVRPGEEAAFEAWLDAPPAAPGDEVGDLRRAILAGDLTRARAMFVWETTARSPATRVLDLAPMLEVERADLVSEVSESAMRDDDERPAPRRRARR